MPDETLKPRKPRQLRVKQGRPTPPPDKRKDQVMRLYLTPTQKAFAIEQGGSPYVGALIQQEINKSLIV